VLPSAHPSPQPKRHIDQFSRFCAAHGTKSLYFTMGDPFLEPAHAHNPNGITIGSAVFAQVTAECPYTLQLAPFPLKIARSHKGIWTPI